MSTAKYNKECTDSHRPALLQNFPGNMAPQGRIHPIKNHAWLLEEHVVPHQFHAWLGIPILVPIPGTSIGSGILILLLILEILVGFFFRISLLKNPQIGIPILKFGIPKFLFRMKSVHLILYQKTIAISFPAKITSTHSNCITSRCDVGRTQNK
jgi:hypothetical protein